MLLRPFPLYLARPYPKRLGRATSPTEPSEQRDATTGRSSHDIGIDIFNRNLIMQKKSVFQSTAIISICTATSRGLGLVREILMANYFGTSLAKSAFDVAFKVPNLFRRLFGEGALSAAFIPVFTESIQNEGVEEAGKLANRIMTMLLMTLLFIAVGGIVIISICLHWFNLGERVVAVLPLLRIMLPYMVFICLVALSMGILNTFHHFTIPAFTPVLLNIVWISALLFALPSFGVTTMEQIYAVAWAVLVAGILQLLLQIPVLLKFGFKPRLSFNWKDPRVKKVLLLMAPVALGMGLVQINVVLDGVLAFYVGKWAPSALVYAERLIYLPLGIFATALGTVLLPTFSHQVTGELSEDMRKTMNGALCALMLVMIPATIGLITLAEPLVMLLFERGKFDGSSTIYTMRAVWFYAPGLLFFSIYKIFVPAFYAMQDTKTPVRVGISMVFLNLALNIIFIMTWPTGYRHAGLAFATVITSVVSCLILGILLHKRMGSLQWWRIFIVAIRALIASACMGATAWYIHSNIIKHCIGRPDLVLQILAIGGAIAGGMIIYFMLAVLFCPNEFKRLLKRGM